MKGGYSKNVTLKGGKKSNGHKANCGCPICKNMKKRGGEGDESSSSDMSDSSSDMSDSSSDMSDSGSSSDEAPMIGGKKSNGHKANCKCPICKNMKKRGKKTQRKTKGGNKKSHRRR
jgi:rubredoxin